MSAATYDAAPVLIVGAGPTGLAAAMSLARAHIPVRLIDKAREPAPHSRAIGIQARTLELFEQHRIVEPFLQRGHRARAANLHSSGQRIARLDFDPLQTRYPYLLFLDQSVTERLLTEHLSSLGVEVERGVELTDFFQGVDGLEATLQHADGRVETLQPSWLIGADGAHSTVRHRLGLSFAGKTFSQTFLLADLALDVDWPDDELNMFASGEGLAALFPMGGGIYRLIADQHANVVALVQSHLAAQGALVRTSSSATSSSANPMSDEPIAASDDAVAKGAATAAADAPTLEQCRELVARRIHHPMRLTSLVWSAYFHLNSRMVEQLRTRRVFLAGDAGHVHSPAGAQGMNTGIQEAFNLGWKLARVMKGEAPERLLDTYHAERHPIERDVLRQTAFVTHMAEAERGPLKLLREKVMPLLAQFGPLRDAARTRVSELSIQYRRSPLTLERVLDGGPRAGERAPDALVHVVDGPLGRAPGVGCVFDLHDPAYFSLFLLVEADGELEASPEHPIPPAVSNGANGAANGSASREAELTRFVAAVERALPGAVRVWRITDAGGDHTTSLADTYGRTRPAFYLVRPDGYICARGRTASDLTGLLRHCESWFSKGMLTEETSARV
ncbi:FAD-dependent monooxygenase [Paraburkholderia phosphatilytica]|uniref:FAD-dependent monooxygenase n=1 Tax=Paraburkholderia phosphatilytica TaxID=2282883 RepID=UPI000E469BA9|nr:FAD-dependent monooxygenase [Paraburkholderia phosphatilytica]